MNLTNNSTKNSNPFIFFNSMIHKFTICTHYFVTSCQSAIQAAKSRLADGSTAKKFIIG